MRRGEREREEIEVDEAAGGERLRAGAHNGSVVIVSPGCWELAKERLGQEKVARLGQGRIRSIDGARPEASHLAAFLHPPAIATARRYWRPTGTAGDSLDIPRRSARWPRLPSRPCCIHEAILVPPEIRRATSKGYFLCPGACLSARRPALGGRRVNISTTQRPVPLRSGRQLCAREGFRHLTGPASAIPATTAR